MPRNGAGTYSRVAGTPYVYDTVIDQAIVNDEMDDIATALTGSLAKDGQTTPTANLPMATYKHTGVGDASARDQYAAYGQVQDSAPQWAGTAGGTADALTLTVTPAITAYAAGQTFRFKSGSSANTGATTVAVSGLTTKAIQNNGSALSAGIIAASKWYEITYDGTAFQLKKIGTATGAELDLEIGVDVQAYDADTLKADTADVLTAGFAATPYDAGTKSTGTFTPDEANGNFQYYVNGGAHTLAPPTNNCTLVIQITNNASAGTITTSGFTKVTGAIPGTTNGDDFIAYITKINGFSHLQWQALQ